MEVSSSILPSSSHGVFSNTLSPSHITISRFYLPSLTLPSNFSLHSSPLLRFITFLVPFQLIYVSKIQSLDVPLCFNELGISFYIICAIGYFFMIDFDLDFVLNSVCMIIFCDLSLFILHVMEMN